MDQQNPSFGMPGMPAMPPTCNFIDDKHIKDTSGQMKDYPNKLFKICQHDNCKVSGAQLVVIFKKLQNKDQQIDACKLGQFVTNLSADELLAVVKSTSNNDTKITLIMSFHSSLNPGTSYADKEKIAKTLNQSNQKQVLDAMTSSPSGNQSNTAIPIFPSQPMPGFPGQPQGGMPGFPAMPPAPSQPMPGFLPMPATNPPVDESVINNKQGMNNDYANRILKVCQHDGKIITGEQMAKIMKNVNFKDPKIYAASSLAPFVRGLKADHLVAIVKAGCFSDDKLAAIRNLSPMLEQGTSYQDKLKIVQALPFANDQNAAKQAMGL